MMDLYSSENDSRSMSIATCIPRIIRKRKYSSDGADSEYQQSAKRNGCGRWSPIEANSASNTNVPTINTDHIYDTQSSPGCYSPTAEMRPCPLPHLRFVESEDLWEIMCREDENASLKRDPNMFDQHPDLHPQMRTTLLNWLIEVSAACKLHRETYYLAVDYIDRYLSRKKGLKRTHLQLLGITALFVASKVEDRKSQPKIGELAQVTDGACSEKDIRRQEVLLVNALQWSMYPETVIGWLGLYMQINVTSRQRDMMRSHPDTFIYPQFSGLEFAQTARVLDLCSLDVSFVNFPYSVIAAAAISHTFDERTAMNVSGLDWEVIASCAKWIKPYFQICNETEDSSIALVETNEPIENLFSLAHVCPSMVGDSAHIIQTHSTSLEMFDSANSYCEDLEAVACMLQHELQTVF